MYKWNWKRFTARLIGNFLISFVSPFVGTQIVLNASMLESFIISAISSTIILILIAGRELLQYADSKAN